MLLRGILCTLFSTLLAVSPSFAGDRIYKWSKTAMDGSRTGVRPSGADDVEAAMGSVKGRKYYAPSGRVYSKGSVRDVAKIMLDVQPEMADVKKVIAHSKEAMIRKAPECALSDWFVDALMARCSELTGKKVDAGFVNFGGIRVDMPGGDVLLDDILSMFPFKNNLCYLELYGRDIRVLMEQMAKGKWLAIGGIRCLASKDGRLLKAEIDGKPLDDNKIYGVATISFLLDGGDGYSIARNSVKLDILDQYIIDVMLPYVERITAEGRLIEYKADGRVKITDWL